MTKYTKKEREKFRQIDTHLKVLNERTRQLKTLIKQRKKKGSYNQTDMKKLLTKIKSAKVKVADAGFI